MFVKTKYRMTMDTYIPDIRNFDPTSIHYAALNEYTWRGSRNQKTYPCLKHIKGDKVKPDNFLFAKSIKIHAKNALDMTTSLKGIRFAAEIMFLLRPLYYGILLFKVLF